MLESRTRLVAAAYVALRRGDEVLLQLRQGTGYRDGHWALLAGHLERDESVLDAAVREAAEEAGVGRRPGRPRAADHAAPFRARRAADRAAGRLLLPDARRGPASPTVREPHRTAEMGWFALDALPEPVVPHELAGAHRRSPRGRSRRSSPIRMDDPGERY